MKIGDVLNCLEKWSPLMWQEEYDNSGLQTGDREAEVKGILVALDCTEAVLDEAIAAGTNLVVTHHPVIFPSVKKITNQTHTGRLLTKAIQNQIAVYSLHTNLDNVLHGVSGAMAQKLGLQHVEILQPKNETLLKLVVFCPHSHSEAIRTAMFNQGAGVIGHYSECSFNVQGEGTFKAENEARPYVGKTGIRHTEAETRIELVVPAAIYQQVINAMVAAHPYEEVAYDIFPLKNTWKQVGSGVVGELPEDEEETTFLKRVRDTFGCGVIRHNQLTGRPVRRVALCGGSGAFLLPAAIASKAQLFITADVKYHHFTEAEDQLVIADIGHFESEHVMTESVSVFLKQNFNTFAVRLSKAGINPVKYL